MSLARLGGLRAAAVLAAAMGVAVQSNAQTTDTATEALYLNAFVNGIEKGLIIRVDARDGRFYTSADELDEIGVATRDLPLDADRQIALDAIPGLAYSYDERAQRIDLSLPASALVAQPLGFPTEPVAPPQSDTGIVLNYAARLQLNRFELGVPPARRLFPVHRYGFGRMPLLSRETQAEGNERRNREFSVGIDARVFSPVGAFVNSLYASHEPDGFDAIRQDSYWTYSSRDRLRSYYVGDFISASLPWTRAIRMGGIRVARNFDLRPDLVTFPVPELGGNAVVPTTVDLYINNMRQFSGEATGGPFVIVTPPSLSGAGTAVLTYRDAIGRDVVQTRRLYIDADLMAKGLMDYSFELGYPRRGYGVHSFDYADSLATMGSLRYGIGDMLTLEGHFETGEDLHNLGAGLLWQIGRFGVANLAVAASGGDGSGTLTSVGYQYIAPRWNLDAREIRAHSDYRDLGVGENVGVPPRMSRFSFGWSVTPNHHLALDYTRQESSFDLIGTRFVTLAYSGTIGRRLSLYASVFKDIDSDQPAGAYVGMSLMFDGRVSASAGLSRFGDDRTATVNVGRSVDFDRGGFGWTVGAEGGNDDYRDGGATLQYQGRYGEVTAQAGGGQIGDVHYRNASLYGGGAIVYMGHSLQASRPIYDAFAVVDVQTPNVTVLRENRPVGRTGRGGRLLIPDLLPNQNNLLAIDPLGLPLNASVGADRASVVPRELSGVLVRFDVERFTGATVVLQDEQGAYLPAGATAVLRETGETVLVGYDGQVFFKALKPHNTVTSGTADGRTCAAVFEYADTDAMTVIGPFRCRSTAGEPP